jgi:hypothetical protein
MTSMRRKVLASSLFMANRLMRLSEASRRKADVSSSSTSEGVCEREWSV